MGKSRLSPAAVPAGDSTDDGRDGLIDVLKMTLSIINFLLFISPLPLKPGKTTHQALDRLHIENTCC
jgi:hypothetical protein